MDFEQYKALTADDLEWLRSMGWEPQFDSPMNQRRDGAIRVMFLPTISNVGYEAPTVAEFRAR